MFFMMNVTSMDTNLEGDGISSNPHTLLTYSLVLVIGIPGNIIILSIYGRKKRKTSTDVLIIGQSIVDFLACVCTPALIVRSCFYRLVTTGLCRFACLAETSSAFTSLFFTAVISIDRYLAVCRPLRRRLTTRSSILASVAVVITGVVISIPGAVFEVARPARAGDDVCSRMLPYAALLAQSIALVLLFALSLITSTIMYLIIYAFLQKRAKIHDKLVGNELPVATFQPRKDAEGLVSVEPPTSSSNVRGNNSLVVEDISKEATAIEKGHPDKLSSMTNSLPHSAGSTMPSNSDSMSKMPNPQPGGLTPEAPPTSSNAHFSTNPSHPSTRSTQPSLFRRLSRRHRSDRPRAPKSKEINMGRKTTRMLLVITVYFFVTWIPKIVYSVLSKETNSAISRTRILDTVIDVLIELRFTNHIINVFVYSMVNDGFRSSVRKMFSLSRKK